jgi:hypothetical protein
MKKVFERLKSKWGINSNRDLVLICLTFSLAGMSILRERPIVFHAIGIQDATPFWLKALVYIPLIFPLYQINLLIFGTLLGQFPFFWEKERHLVKLILRPFNLVRR